MDKLAKKTDMITVWEQPEQIRQLFAPNLTQQEFEYFMGLSKALEANPFKREIWAVKYDKNKAAQIFCGRDFYRRKAQELPNYEGHHKDAVYEKDSFQVINGEVTHTYQIGDRGKLIGAYCVVYVTGRKVPFYEFVELSEYNKPSKTQYKNTWDEKPATMIKKVAEAQALRGAFQGVFEGTYSESEQWEQEPNKQPQSVTEQQKREIIHEQLENALNGKPIDKEALNMPINPGLSADVALRNATQESQEYKDLDRDCAYNIWLMKKSDQADIDNAQYQVEIQWYEKQEHTLDGLKTALPKLTEQVESEGFKFVVPSPEEMDKWSKQMREVFAVSPDLFDIWANARKTGRWQDVCRLYFDAQWQYEHQEVQK